MALSLSSSESRFSAEGLFLSLSLFLRTDHVCALAKTDTDVGVGESAPSLACYLGISQVQIQGGAGVSCRTLKTGGW